MLDFDKIRHFGEYRENRLRQEAEARRLIVKPWPQRRLLLAPLVVRCADALIALGQWLKASAGTSSPPISSSLEVH